MTKRFLEAEEIYDLARQIQGNIFFADEEEETEEDPDIDKGGKTDA